MQTTRPGSAAQRGATPREKRVSGRPQKPVTDRKNKFGDYLFNNLNAFSTSS
jgi:hypothetical protein